jgi:transcriptional regulator with GAF, ATPase, and Fis domain
VHVCPDFYFGVRDMSKAFDDEFLERLLPGEAAEQAKLRQRVKQLNTPKNIQLVRCVLISGESGSGKNHLARVMAAHRTLSDNQGMQELIGANLSACLTSFDEIHLPALSSDLAMSELFGHEAEAFTGAKTKKIGLLSDKASSPRTDILLDEIGDASAELQARLLQVVETGSFRPVGAEPGDEEETSARLFFATNRDLAKDVREGRFREDLFWRVTEFQLSMIPLRQQAAIIPKLISEILIQLREGLADVTSVLQAVPSSSDLDWAMRYEWPGNVRELRTVLKRWLVEDCRMPLHQLVVDLPNRLRRTDDTERGYEAEFSPAGDHKRLSYVQATNTQRLRDAVIRWYDKARPSNEALQMIFSEMQPASVRQKISDWKRNRG